MPTILTAYFFVILIFETKFVLDRRINRNHGFGGSGHAPLVRRSPSNILITKPSIPYRTAHATKRWSFAAAATTVNNAWRNV